jgi:7-cyano-7-deazaguanine synthase in queuosine biosynthesis
MKSSYVLKPNDFLYNIDEHFPKLEKNKKVGIFLSGGMESSLISLIALSIYGKNNLTFFFSDNIFSSNDSIKNSYIHTNIKKAAKILDITPTYLNFNYDSHITDRKKSIETKIKNLEIDYNIQFVMFGLTKLFFEVEIFKQDNITIEKIRDIAYSEPLKFKSTIEEFHLDTNEYTWELMNIDIPANVYQLLRDSLNFIKNPFNVLNKCEVIDLYRQLNFLDILFETSSCITKSLTEVKKHCGNCFNCQNRHDAFKILGIIEDRTKYLSDNVIKRRLKLEEIQNVIHT